MKIKYLAHASFLITSDSGTKIVTDPYAASGGLKYKPITEAADIVTVSHEHGDHNYTAAVKGNPVILKTDGETKGIKFKVVAAAHDDHDGKQRGKNSIFCFEVDGVKICHAGDLGHILTPAQTKSVGKVDVLMLPVGGFFTIDAAAATVVGEQLNPAIIFPMHYKTDKADFPIAGVGEFLVSKANATRSKESEIELSAGKLPEKTQIIVLKPALMG
jgi:L-ascorbate metabolism protein UlaG (beta-lactamase superfamily)